MSKSFKHVRAALLSVATNTEKKKIQSDNVQQRTQAYHRLIQKMASKKK